MTVSLFALAAAAAVQAAPSQSNGVQWVPLKQSGQQAAPQAVVQPTPVAPIAAPATTSAILRVGTVVPLRLSEELTTKGKKLRVGNRFHLETSEPVMVQGVNVIPVGSPAVGEISMSATRACGANRVTSGLAFSTSL